jgi:polyisoprenoid-binding protein YceI
VALVGLVAPGCEDQKASGLAPTASALVAAPAAPAARTLSVDRPSSRVTFTMEAPQEKIRGVVAEAVTGSIAVDPKDLTKTTGVLRVDLAGLELFQAKAADDGTFAAEEKVELQNRHARAWLEIGDDAPEAERKKNEVVEFAIRSIDAAEPRDVTAATGAERKASVTATGEVLLHQRKSTKTVSLEATFTFDGDRLTSVRLRTVEPFPIGLAEHDVRPREAFGKLAQKTLDVLAPKVAKEAAVAIDLTARPSAP